ncbi:F-box only protein 30-like [Tubulanus polymorphus]|uniref:F-box only protein 30-like n=1 Tax=Tubulanus polymorphus TaxID=672921 RepID=UPI003DA57AC7
MESDMCKHDHCRVCFNLNCKKPASNASCRIINCLCKCGARFHECKQTEHALLCANEKVRCINHENGCPVAIVRRELGVHLERCPASVVYCTMEWNRWPLYSKERQIRVPFSQNNVHARFGQMDVALAMRDQRMLNESMKAPRKTRRVLQNTLTRKYPAVPLHLSYSRDDSLGGDTDPASNDTSRTVSEDESDSPWERAKMPPGLQRSICSKLYRATMQTTESLTVAINTAIHATLTSPDTALEDIPENEATSAHSNSGSLNDYSFCDNLNDEQTGNEEPVSPGEPTHGGPVSLGEPSHGGPVCPGECSHGGPVSLGDPSHDGPESPGECSADADPGDTELALPGMIKDNRNCEIQNGAVCADDTIKTDRRFDLSPDLKNDVRDLTAVDTNTEETLSEVEVPKPPPNMEMILNELLGLDLYIESITRYQAKPCSMYTFLCAQQFRRDEYAWHFKNVHCDVHSGINGWMEQRCPLAQYGCTYSFRRFQPAPNDSTVVYSQTLESFGIKTSVVADDSIESLPAPSGGGRSNGYCDDYKSTRGPSRSRSRSPSRSKESTPEIYTSYNFASNVHLHRPSKSPVKTSGRDSTLTTLPFEVLRYLTRYLDGFSLNNLAMTNHLLRDVCCSVLEDRGIVIPHWEREQAPNDKIVWKIAFKRWFFSTVFTPVDEWKFTDYQPIGEHLKQCLFNKRLIRKRPYLFPMTGELPVDIIDKLFAQAEEMQNSDLETQYASLNFDDVVD